MIYMLGLTGLLLCYCLSTKKLIFSLSWGKNNMASAASREVPMTKQVVKSIEALGNNTIQLPSNIIFIFMYNLPSNAFVGHRVGEVAHDYVPALKVWLDGKGIKNLYVSWHGM